MDIRYGLDTNVLLALENKAHAQHHVADAALVKLTEGGVELCFTLQNLGEFWNASTRPLERNGYGMSPSKVLQQIDSIERKLTLLAESEQVYRAWKLLLIAHNVRGVQVHDAHLAAVLQVHGVGHLLTFNTKDFQRFPALTAVHPAQL